MPHGEDDLFDLGQQCLPKVCPVVTVTTKAHLPIVLTLGQRGTPRGVTANKETVLINRLVTSPGRSISDLLTFASRGHCWVTKGDSDLCV